MFDLAGKTLGKYRLVEKIGQGGMAQVYKAYQPDLDRYVAIKIMHPHLTGDPEFQTRFQREARAVAALEHPHIVHVYDFDADQGLAFLVMENVEGASLKDLLHDLNCRAERLSLAEVVRITAALADALDYAHRHGVVHRDLKPSNVLLTDDGRPVLVDFGIARMLDATTVSASGSTLGTPTYMSPEQGRGEPGDARSDIYALGVILYQLCTGRVPFEADTPYAIILKHITAPLPPPRTVCPSLPEPLERAILKALAKDPGDRFQAAGEMGAAICAAIESPAGPGAAHRVGKRARRGRPLFVGAALVALVVVLAWAMGLPALIGREGRTTPEVPDAGGTAFLALRGPEVTVDTWLDPDMPDQSWHEADLVHLQGPLTPDRILFRFDLAALPAGAHVLSATLAVRTELWGKESFPGAAVAYRLLTPWDPTQASYSAPWSRPGLAAGWDYDATPLDVAPVPDAGTLVLDVTAAARAWLERGEPNHGLLIMMAEDSHNQAHHWVYLSEQAGPADQPLLRIVYEGAP